METYTDVAGCPHCRTRLLRDDDTRVRCSRCDRPFTILDGVPALIREEDAPLLAGYGANYSQARSQDGFQPMTPSQARTLPFGHPPGYPALYWQTRRQTFRALMRLLRCEGPRPTDGPVADLGAGVGWLSYRLSIAGYRVVAVDVSLDGAFGLGAAAPFLGDGSFARLQGSLEWPPLLAKSHRLIILNASLHYAADLAGTLARIGECLSPHGRFVIMDTPIARAPRPGTPRGGDRHLGRRELSDALARTGFCSRWVRVPRGPHWWMHWVKTRLKRSPRFSFPMVIADKLS